MKEDKPRPPRPFSVGPVRVRVVASMGHRHEDGHLRWYFRAERHEGGRSRGAWSGWATLDEATAAVACLVGGVARPAGSGRFTVGDLLAEWLATREDARDAGVLAVATVSAQRYACEHLAGHLQLVVCDRVDRATLERYRDARLRQGAAPLTTRAELATLRSAWRWGQQTGRVEGELHLPRVPVEYRRTRRTPTRGDVVEALAHLEGWRRAMVLLHAATGARLGELAGLRWRDVDLEAGSITVTGKTGPRTVPLSAPALATLRAWREAQGDVAPGDGCWGVRARTATHKMGPALARACALAGVERFTTNGLRRAIVDQVYRAPGVDIAAAAALLGHSPQTAMRVYRQVTGDDQRRVVEQARLGYLGEPRVLDLADRRKS